MLGEVAAARPEDGQRVEQKPDRDDDEDVHDDRGAGLPCDEEAQAADDERQPDAPGGLEPLHTRNLTAARPWRPAIAACGAGTAPSRRRRPAVRSCGACVP